ncbi:MAG TPA: hypothetical protein VFA98_12460, partial [Thermoanaerobaculia bacterium]|nr:hypothetical protein [Thermoanaerobaculia bacterium]
AGGRPFGGGDLAALSPVVLIQALFALLRRSLGSVLKAIFGWATLALFGEVREDERTLLTATVGAAAVWPFLVTGTVFPRQAALFLTILPVPKGTPAEIVRAIWIVLTLVVPLGVGWALTRRNRGAGGAAWKSVLMGFPASLGIGLAFLVACVSVPVRKIVAMARGRKDEHVPLAIEPGSYAATVERLRSAIARAGIQLQPRRPPWATRALGRILHGFAGEVLGAYLPERLEFLWSPHLELTFYPNGVRVSGTESRTARAHALLAESATASPALQCMSPEGQKVEKRLKAMWQRRQDGGAGIDDAIRREARRLAAASIDYDDWQILYRELLQVLVASRGAEALIRTAIQEAKSGPQSHARRVARFGGVLGRARSYGESSLASAAANRSADVLGKFLGRVLGAFAGRR